MPAKRYKVTLTKDERRFLKKFITTGKGAAYKITRARILLKADECPGGAGWTDSQIMEAIDVSRCMVERTRETFVEKGLEAALSRKAQERPGNQKFDGVKEAHLVTLACSSPPQGRERWTLQLLADKMVELKHFDSISHEAVRQTLKKTKLSPG